MQILTQRLKIRQKSITEYATKFCASCEKIGIKDKEYETIKQALDHNNTQLIEQWYDKKFS